MQVSGPDLNVLDGYYLDTTLSRDLRGWKVLPAGYPPWQGVLPHILFSLRGLQNKQVDT